MARIFCYSVVQQAAANNLCLKFQHLYCINYSYLYQRDALPYLTSSVIVSSPLERAVLLGPTS